MQSTHWLTSLSFLALAAVELPAQQPARAEARAEARPATARSSQTVTHRVVVENGKTVVDERTVDGKPVGGGKLGGGVRPVPGGAIDAEEMLRKLREQVEGDLGRALPPLPAGLPPRAGQPLPATRSSDSHSDSHRVVVRDGATVVDERTTDGKRVDGPAPVKPIPPVERPVPGSGKLEPRVSPR